MPRISFAGFRDPIRRPRYIIWSIVGLLVFAAVMIATLGVTSTRWFCSEGCHKVQDDTILAYQHSSHANISCMSCHMPVGATPVTFLLHKAEALGELYLTVTNQYELPLNGESEVALTMPTKQCTQCHNPDLRTVTPTKGILIDHKVHDQNDVSCAICHNRIAHREDFKPTLKDPRSGKPNRVHADFMTMTACFRCHTQEAESPGLKAPGKCSACHPADFELKPPSHREPGFFPSGHAELAMEEKKRAAAVRAAGGEAEGAGVEGSETAPAERTAESEALGESLPAVEGIESCSTCHAKKFCNDCHGVEMPHPASFRPTTKGANTEEHAKAGKKNTKVCARCHGGTTQFCDDCHHGTQLDWEYSAAMPWLRQHPQAVQVKGAQACFDCHQPTYCAACHVNGPDAVR